jgi:hypothetical protein
MIGTNLKNYYKNDVVLLQFSALYLSLKIFNEISEKGLKEKEDTMKGLLNQILNMIENIKVEGQKKHYEIFAKQIIGMAFGENENLNCIKCIKDFSILYLQYTKDNIYDNLDYLLELKTSPSLFEQEYQKYKENKKKGNNKSLIEIVEKIISYFLNNSLLGEKEYFSYYKIVSGDKSAQSSSELKQEINNLQLKIKNITESKDKLLSEKNVKIKEANKKISDFQLNEKNLKKINNQLEREKQTINKEKNDLNNKLSYIMQNIDELKKQQKEKDNQIQELINKQKEKDEVSMKQRKEKDNQIQELIKEQNKNNNEDYNPSLDIKEKNKSKDDFFLFNDEANDNNNCIRNYTQKEEITIDDYLFEQNIEFLCECFPYIKEKK